MARYTMNRPYKKEILKKLQRSQVQILKDFIRVCDQYELPYFAVYGTAIGAVRHQGFIPWDDDTDVAMLRDDYEVFLSIAEKELGKEYRIMTPEHDERYACTVTHLQRKHTKFVPQFSKDAAYSMCIDLDIFPLDYVAEDRKCRIRQARNTNILGRLLFLSGNKYPVIPVEGAAGKLMEWCCVIIHYALRFLRLTPRKLYRRYLAEATAYRQERGAYVTSFEYPDGLKDRVKVDALFPVRMVPFEDIMIAVPKNNDEFLKKVYGAYMEIPPKSKQINHAPYLIQFEGEECIYQDDQVELENQDS